MLDVRLEVVNHDIDGVTGILHGQVIDERVQRLVVRMLDLYPGSAQARHVHEGLVSQHVLFAGEHVSGRQAGHALGEERREIRVCDDLLECVPQRGVAVDDDAGRVVLRLYGGRQQGPVYVLVICAFGSCRRVRVRTEQRLQATTWISASVH